MVCDSAWKCLLTFTIKIIQNVMESTLPLTTPEPHTPYIHVNQQLYTCTNLISGMAQLTTLANSTIPQLTIPTMISPRGVRLHGGLDSHTSIYYKPLNSKSQNHSPVVHYRTHNYNVLLSESICILLKLLYLP